MREIAVYGGFGWTLESAAERSDRSAFVAPADEVSLVQQQFSEEVDMNWIAKRFGISPSSPLGDVGGVYADFTGISDYESALAAVDRADRRFMSLPPEFRERFGNDPGRLIEAARSMTPEEFVAALAPRAPGGEPPAASGDLPPS